MTPELKICGLTRRQDAVASARAGAAYLGAVFAPESPRAVSPEHAAAIFAGLNARRVGVFVDASTAEVVAAAGAASLAVIQLHGEEGPSQLRELRRAGPWSLWKAVRVRDAAAFRRALDLYGELADGLLLDGWAPSARGGTGARFDWAAVAPLRSRVPIGVKLIVAGGLRAANLAAAVELLRPDAVDVSSGVELGPGIKDAAAIAAMMKTLHEIGACP